MTARGPATRIGRLDQDRMGRHRRPTSALSSPRPGRGRERPARPFAPARLPEPRAAAAARRSPPRSAAPSGKAGSSAKAPARPAAQAPPATSSSADCCQSVKATRRPPVPVTSPIRAHALRPAARIQSLGDPPGQRSPAIDQRGCKAAPPSRPRAASPRPARRSPHRPRRSAAAAPRSAGKAAPEPGSRPRTAAGPTGPPASPRCRLASPSRESVVFVAMMPATPEASATSANLGQFLARQVGRDLQEDRDRPRTVLRAPPSHLQSNSLQRRGRAPATRAGVSVLGEETFDRREIPHAGPQHASTRAKSPRAVAALLFAPRFRPTGTAGFAAASRARDRLHPLVA